MQKGLQQTYRRLSSMWQCDCDCDCCFPEHIQENHIFIIIKVDAERPSADLQKIVINVTVWLWLWLWLLLSWTYIERPSEHRVLKSPYFGQVLSQWSALFFKVLLQCSSFLDTVLLFTGLVTVSCLTNQFSGSVSCYGSCHSVLLFLVQCFLSQSCYPGIVQ
jgi:hypothetical protein